MKQRTTRRPSRLTRAAVAGLTAYALASGGPAGARARSAGARALHSQMSMARGLPPAYALSQLALGAQPVPRKGAPPFAGGPDDVTRAIEAINDKYLARHLAYEVLFWSTKMNHPGANNTADALAAAKTSYDSFMGDVAELDTVRELLKREDLAESQRLVLDTMKRTFELYTLETAEQKKLKAELNQREADLGAKRDGMVLGFKDPKQNGTFVEMSSVGLRNTMRVSEDEATRKACYEGMKAVGPFVAKDLVEIVKLRNKIARSNGYVDYYDYKAQASEQMTKVKLFEILDGLEKRTRPLLDKARARLAAEKGAAALEPWNSPQALSGDSAKEMDPYFPFENAVDVWARTFAALGISYSGAEAKLDLLDRAGKYSNGFCHWPQPVYRKADGTFVTSKTDFTSLAVPSDKGSGFTALTTLMHEGGHAAHYANIDQASPFCSQERPPFSVALAETQAMTLEEFGNDAGWMARYALSRDGKVIPWSVIENSVRSSKPYSVFGLRSMLVVSYFEKALYELPEAELTAERVVALGDEVEKKIQGGLSSRPVLSVPHILADESSAYYHGYTLADMAVHQTRRALRRMLGVHDLTDRPEVGALLSGGYWKPGNTVPYLTMVERVTGEPLSAEAWVDELETPLEEVIAQEKADYVAALAKGARYSPADLSAVEKKLDVHIEMVHGALTISDSKEDGGLGPAMAKFAKFVRDKYFRK